MNESDDQPKEKKYVPLTEEERKREDRFVVIASVCAAIFSIGLALVTPHAGIMWVSPIFFLFLALLTYQRMHGNDTSQLQLVGLIGATLLAFYTAITIPRTESWILAIGGLIATVVTYQRMQSESDK